MSDIKAIAEEVLHAFRDNSGKLYLPTISQLLDHAETLARHVLAEQAIATHLVVHCS